MSERMDGKLLVCTDLDRTLVANGRAVESPGARACFDALVSRPEIILAYVSGRHLALVQQAISEFRLPTPGFIIADVGTSIYHPGPDGRWQSQDTWRQEIARDWGGRKALELHRHLQDLPGLELQEDSKQGDFKLSYYFPAAVDPDGLAKRAQSLLSPAGIQARVITGIDEMRGIGLLDVIPARASKLHAIEALMRELGVTPEGMVFSGDSGNDLEVLASPLPAVLVANASNEIKDRARELALQSGNASALHVARGGFLGMNGCYSAGILEGIAHFHPHTRDWMEQAAASSLAERAAT